MPAGAIEASGDTVVSSGVYDFQCLLVRLRLGVEQTQAIGCQTFNACWCD